MSCTFAGGTSVGGVGRERREGSRPRQFGEGLRLVGETRIGFHAGFVDVEASDLDFG